MNDLHDVKTTNSQQPLASLADFDIQRWRDRERANGQEEGEEGAAEQIAEEEDHQQNRWQTDFLM